MKDSQIYIAASALGIVAGLRTMAAPAMVTQAAKQGSLAVEGSKLEFLNSKSAFVSSAVLAAGELIADKLPATPARTEWGPLSARTVSGAVCGAVFCAAKRRSAWVGGICGALGAVGGTFFGYHLRRTLTESLSLPDTVVALAEDAVVVGTGLLLASQLKSDAGEESTAEAA